MGLLKICPRFRAIGTMLSQLQATRALGAMTFAMRSPYSSQSLEKSTTTQTSGGGVPVSGGNVVQELRDSAQEPSQAEGSACISPALLDDLSEAAVVAKRKKSNVQKERGPDKVWIKRYEKAVADGYTGSYEIWKLSENPLVVNRRITGSCPYISSLQKLERSPLPEELMRTSIFGSQHRMHQVMRKVVVNNQVVGEVHIYIPRMMKQGPLEPLWLRPYFDPEAKLLRFQLADGSDYPFSKPLASLAVGSCTRPLLYLAHAEGLIDSVPEDRLQTLVFDAMRRSGFAMHARIKPQDPKRPTFRGTMHVRLDGLGDQGATSDGPTPVLKAPSIKFVFTPKNNVDRKYINYFPYIADDGHELRLWDTDEGRDIILSRRNQEANGLTAREVRERYPLLYALARSEGFRADS
ncbi:hypothetical protein FRB94_007708 [Tulasnella sp. JGI-2019a]|nr:hypothetical protein FRB94_007708 [Tulasnella sp. JGI-2019a]